MGQEVSAARSGFPAQRSVFQGAIGSVFSGNLQCALVSQFIPAVLTRVASVARSSAATSSAPLVRSKPAVSIRVMFASADTAATPVRPYVWGRNVLP